MNIAEWILVTILSFTFFIFLICAIILITKLIDITKETKKIIMKSQDIADNANGVVANIKGMTSIGGVVQTLADKYVDPKYKPKEKTNGKKPDQKTQKN